MRFFLYSLFIHLLSIELLRRSHAIFLFCSRQIVFIVRVSNTINFRHLLEMS